MTALEESTAQQIRFTINYAMPCELHNAVEAAGGAFKWKSSLLILRRKWRCFLIIGPHKVDKGGDKGGVVQKSIKSLETTESVE